MKRNFSVIFIILACIMLVGCFSSFNIKLNKSSALAEEIIPSNSKSQYLIEPFTNTVIYSKDETKRLPIASMCKIMTLLLTFEAKDRGEFSLEDKIVVSENAAKMGGSQVFLENNAEYYVGDLIKSIVVASANDASVAMAEKIAGSEEAFVKLMNEKASDLGMKNTIFVNCTGLPKPGQYSCAKDVAIMFSELIKHEEYFRFSKIWTDKIFHPNDRITEISNTNKLVRFYQGCEGGKTGYTAEAGHCLVAVASRNGMRLVSVVISSPDSKTRFNEVSSMFNYGFANFVNKKIVDNEKPLDLNVTVLGGKKDKLEVVAEEPFYIFSEKNQKRSIESSFIPIDKIKAPIYKGDVVGLLEIYENDVKIAEIPVISNEDVYCKTYFDVIKDVLNEWAIA